MRKESSDKPIPPCRQNGFTLVEILVTLVVASITLGIAIPSFAHLMTSNSLVATTNAYVSAINTARVEAIKRNSTVQFCSNSAANNGNKTLGTACGTLAGAVFSTTASGTASPAIRTAVSVPSGLEMGDGNNNGTAMQALLYNGSGLATTPSGTLPYTGLVADIYSDRISSNNHHCIYITTGSVLSSCTITQNAGGCPALEPSPCQN